MKVKADCIMLYPSEIKSNFAEQFLCMDNNDINAFKIWQQKSFLLTLQEIDPSRFYYSCKLKIAGCLYCQLAISF